MPAGGEGQQAQRDTSSREAAWRTGMLYARPSSELCHPADHDLHAYLALLRREGNLTLVGAPDRPYALSAFGLIFGNKSLSGSLIGGIQATQELLDFCGEHRITSDVEVIPIQKLDEAYERLLRSDVKYRFSIDMASLTRE